MLCLTCLIRRSESQVKYLILALLFHLLYIRKICARRISSMHCITLFTSPWVRDRQITQKHAHAMQKQNHQQNMQQWPHLLFKCLWIIQKKNNEKIAEDSISIPLCYNLTKLSVSGIRKMFVGREFYVNALQNLPTHIPEAYLLTMKKKKKEHKQ